MPSASKIVKIGNIVLVSIVLCSVGQELEKQWSEAVTFGDKKITHSAMTAYFRHKNTCSVCQQQVC